jgi:hypothetical protein
MHIIDSVGNEHHEVLGKGNDAIYTAYIRAVEEQLAKFEKLQKELETKLAGLEGHSSVNVVGESRGTGSKTSWLSSAEAGPDTRNCVAAGEGLILPTRKDEPFNEPSRTQQDQGAGLSPDHPAVRPLCPNQRSKYTMVQDH